MKIKRGLILLGLGLPLAVLLALAFRDFMRESVIVPLLYAFWIVRLYVESLPQPFLWLLLIVMALLIAGRSLMERGRSREKRRGMEIAPSPGRVAPWVERISMAAHSGYFRARLARHLGPLALEALAQRERRTVKQVKAGLASGKFDGPADIKAYLQAGLMKSSANPLSELTQRLPWGQRTSPLDLDPEEIVNYLEDQLSGSKGGPR